MFIITIQIQKLMKTIASIISILFLSSCSVSRTVVVPAVPKRVVVRPIPRPVRVYVAPVPSRVIIIR